MTLPVALYARTSAADLGRETAEQILAGLAAYAAGRGWEVALECVDQDPFPEGQRKGLRRLLEAVRAKAVRGVVVRSLSHLARSLRHLSDLGRLLAVQDVALIATEDSLDTTDPGGAIRWRDWLEISGRLDRQLRSEAAKLAHLRTSGERWGRPAAVVNPLELLAWWEGRGGRRPLSLRVIAQKLSIQKLPPASASAPSVTPDRWTTQPAPVRSLQGVASARVDGQRKFLPGRK